MLHTPLTRRKLILIGCGLHYQERYHSVLEQDDITIALVIDLQDNKKMITHFFQERKLQPQKILFLEERFRNTITTEEINAFVTKEIDLSTIDGVIISTEPKVRKPYAIWAIQHELPIFMDKPVSAFSHLTDMDRLLADYNEILQLAKQQKIDVIVSCERRAHPGYAYVKEYIKNFIADVRVPITSIDIHFAGGIWNLPHEYLTIENHPFKYGYGILLHSGYHYIDLLTTFLSLNEPISNGGNLEYSLHSMSSRPKDQIHAIGKGGYSSLLEEGAVEGYLSEDFQCKLDNFGETDLILIGQMRKNGNVLTNFSIKLFGTSLSLRRQTSRTQKLEGKVRQEHMILHLGHLASVTLTSLPLQKLAPAAYSTEDFAITILNSPLLRNHKPIQTFNRSEISQVFPEISEGASMNSYARQWQLRSFLRGKDGNSSLESHANTAEMLHRIYSQIKAQLN